MRKRKENLLSQPLPKFKAVIAFEISICTGYWKLKLSKEDNEKEILKVIISLSLSKKIPKTCHNFLQRFFVTVTSNAERIDVGRCNSLITLTLLSEDGH